MAGILRMPSAKHIQNKKKEAKNDLFFASFFILGTYRTAPFDMMEREIEWPGGENERFV
ncbi:hypothetical protein ABID49_002692 [Bhargavaea ullalensis]|uniref:Uncharacterized protein n=1 Tax=Bhargavaea ullalensis TaxID=1265685 RepID=A0ABV2GEM6_9BACL